MNKLLIYPFTKEMCPIIRHRDMLKEYELSAVIPQNGFAWEGKDICELDGGEPTDFLLGSSFLKELEYCAAVFLNANKEELKSEEYTEYITLIENSSKDVLNPSTSIILEKHDLHINQKLKEIPVPVVMVMGLGENCQKFDIQLGIRAAFQREGYRVSQFGTKEYSYLFGFDMLPNVPETPLWEKVYLYNGLFRETYEREKPDVMIIGVPGGIMPITSRFHERFGETALSVSYAARPDIAVLSYYFSLPTQEYFDLYKQFMRFRFGVGNVYFHASNTKFIFNKGMDTVSYLTLKCEDMLEKLHHGSSDLVQFPFNSLQLKPSLKTYQKIIENLKQNIKIL